MTIIVVTVLLGSCTNNPYAISVENFDESGPQTPAAILLSDPQIYARETMLNDRRREADYLERLITLSETATFEPQMKRVLSSVEALQGSLTASFSPAAGVAATNGAELANIQQQIDLKNKLIALQQAQNALDAAKAAAATSPAAGTPAPADSGTTAALNSQIATLQQQVQTLTIQLAQAQQSQASAPPTDVSSRLPGNPPIPDSTITATPSEMFRDRQAYRDELRARQAAEQLDDGHDLDAHALYRFQFNATVLPGEKKNKFAVARLTILPTQMTDKDVKDLYKLWLAHVAYRMNGLAFSGGDEEASAGVDSSYLALGAERELFSYVSLNLLPKNLADNRVLKIVIPPALRKEAEAFVSTWEKSYENSTFLALRLPLLNDFTKGLSLVPSFDPATPQYGTASATCGLTDPIFRQLRVLDYIGASLRGMGEWELLSAGQKKAISNLLEQIAFDQQRVRDSLKPGTDLDSGEACNGKEGNFVPQVFQNFVTDSDTETGSQFAFAYATSPIELAEQLSTMASSIESLQLGLSLAGSVPGQGLNANAALNYLQAARGQVEALERLPLVAGFSDRTDCKNNVGMAPESVGTTSVTASCAQFGWIFGPHAALDPENKKIRLVQGVHNYPVTVDLAVPSWWPKVTMKMESGWVANWYDKTDNGSPLLTAKDSLSTRTIVRPLPHNRADLDGLTEALAYRTMGGALATAHAFRVEPAIISPCGDVSLLVFGANIWRSTEAYLNGVRATDVRVLPDMAGLALTFKALVLPKTDKVNLVIWTRNGPAEHSILLRPSESCPGATDQTAAFQITQPRIVGDDTIIKFISTAPIPGTPAFLQVKSKASKLVYRIPVTPGDAGDGQTYTLTLSGKASATNPFSGWSKATLFDASLELSGLAGTVGAPLKMTPDIVYYPTPPVLVATTDGKAATTMTALNQTIVIKTPDLATSGFTKFDPATATIVATVDGTTDFPLLVTRVPNKNGNIAVTLSLTPGKTEADLRKDAAHTISISVDGSDVPGPCAKCLTLPKSP